MQISINRRDVIWSYISIITTLLSNIVIIPLIVCYLSGDMLGLWYIFVSIGSISNLFDFGFTATFARNITYCWCGAKKLQKKGTTILDNSPPDYVLLKNVLNTCKIVYLLISSFVLILLLTVGTLYIHYISKEIAGYTHYIAWFIYAIGTFLNLYYNYYDSFLRGVGNVKRANRNRAIAKITQLSIMVISLVAGTGIIGVTIAYVIFGIVFRSLGKKYFYEFKNLGRELGKVKEKTGIVQIKELFTIIWYSAWREGLIQLSFYLTGQASVIICSLYFSLLETGIYSVGVQLINAVIVISSSIYNTYQPELQSAHINNDRIKMINGMSIIVASYILSSFGGFVIVALFGLPILKYIKPEMVITMPLLTGIFVSQFILKIRDIYTSYFSCTNRIIYMMAFITSSLFCILLSVLLIDGFEMNVWGIVVSQIVSQMIFNVWYWPRKCHQELNTSFYKIFKNGVTIINSKLSKFMVKR